MLFLIVNIILTRCTANFVPIFTQNKRAYY
nr:MAG TPA: hypothetical protein [Caudoviricetes sp.]